MCLAKESSWAHKRTRKSAWVSTNSSPLGKNYLQGYASNVMQRQHIFKNHTSGWLPGLRSQGKSTPSSWFPAGKTKEQMWIPSPLTTSPAESTVLVPGTAQRLVTNSMGSLTLNKMAPAFVQNGSMQKLCCEQKRFRLTPTESLQPCGSISGSWKAPPKPTAVIYFKLLEALSTEIQILHERICSYSSHFANSTLPHTQFYVSRFA